MIISTIQLIWNCGVHGQVTDFDEATLRGLAERIHNSQTFVEEVRPGQVTPEYLRERDFQQGKRCGVNALYICLRALGRPVSYREVVSAVPIGLRGANMADMTGAANQYGVTFVCLKNVSPGELAELRPPVIAHFDTPSPSPEQEDSLDHFVVIVGHESEKRRFSVIDPSACAHLNLSEDYVARAFSGHCLVVEGNRPVIGLVNESIARAILGWGATCLALIWWVSIELRYRRASGQRGEPAE